MIFSLPSYRRFAETSINRLRKDDGHATPDRLGAILFNIVLLAGLWGIPFYARWLVQSNVNSRSRAFESFVGTWRTTAGSPFQITFTRDGQFVLSWKGTVIETASYWFHEGNLNEVVMSDFFEQPGNRAIGNAMCWFHASATREKLSTTFSFNFDEQWRRAVPKRSYWKIEGEELSLISTVFERVE
jgi:hypothetical protein